MSPEKLSAQTMDLKESLNRFEAAFWDGSFGCSSSATTWKAAYLPYLRKLEQIGGLNLSQECLTETLLSYKLGTRSRQQCGTVLRMLAASTGVSLPEEWQELADGYKPPSKQTKKSLSDNEILEAAAKIPNPTWQMAFGVIATYGLRNYEVFFLDCSRLTEKNGFSLKVLEINNAPQRDILPLSVSWIKAFGIEKLSRDLSLLPKVSTDLSSTTPQIVGRRFTQQLYRYNAGVLASDLRHAWAIKAIANGKPDSITSRMMGLDLPGFVSEYKPWIDARDDQYMRSGSWREAA
jgi:integrase